MDVAELVYCSLVDELVLEDCMQFGWRIKTKTISLEEIYNVEPIPVLKERVLAATHNKKAGRRGTSSSQSSSSGGRSTTNGASSSSGGGNSSSGGSAHAKDIVSCPVCNEVVAGVRFAPHLEKCLNGGKRGARKLSSALDDYSAGLPAVSMRRSMKPKPEHVDPYPNSMVIRIKLRNGVPVANKNRTGATVKDFEAAKKES